MLTLDYFSQLPRKPRRPRLRERAEQRRRETSVQTGAVDGRCDVESAADFPLSERVGCLGEVVQEGLTLCAAQVEERWWKVEGQDCSSEGRDQRGTGTKAGLMSVTQRDSKVGEATRSVAGARLTGVGVVGLIGEDADRRGCDEVIGPQRAYVGEGVGEGGFNKRVFGDGDGLLVAAVDGVRCGMVVLTRCLQRAAWQGCVCSRNNMRF